MPTTSAGALGTPNLPQIDMSNHSAIGSARPKLMDAIAIAKICHQINKAWCEYNGDFSQPDWDDAPEWQRSSAIEGVKFHALNPDAGSDASHNSWMEQKLADGWIYGKEKDPEASPPTHPCIVAFEELPSEQQFKDVLFRAIVRAALD